MIEGLGLLGMRKESAAWNKIFKTVAGEMGLSSASSAGRIAKAQRRADKQYRKALKEAHKLRLAKNIERNKRKILDGTSGMSPEMQRKYLEQVSKFAPNGTYRTPFFGRPRYFMNDQKFGRKLQGITRQTTSPKSGGIFMNRPDPTSPFANPGIANGGNFFSRHPYMTAGAIGGAGLYSWMNGSPKQQQPQDYNYGNMDPMQTMMMMHMMNGGRY